MNREFIESTIIEIRDFLEECADRLGDNNDDYGHCEFWLSNKGGKIRVNFKRSLNIHGPCQAQWSTNRSDSGA